MKKPEKPVNSEINDSIGVAYYNLQTVINEATEKGIDFESCYFRSGDYEQEVVLSFNKNKFSEEEMEKKEKQYKKKLAEYNTWLKSTEGERIKKKEEADKKKLETLLKEKEKLEKEIKKLTI